MTRYRKIAAVLLILTIAAGTWRGVRLWAQQPPAAPAAPAAQDEFVPINELPPEEQLPAAPLLVGAYVFVWVVLLLYVWSVWRRLGKVEQELARLERRTGSSS